MTEDLLDKWLDGEEARRRERVLKRVSEVCAIPATAQRVMTVTSDDDADVKNIADAVSADPAIAAQLLKIANSPLFAQSRQIQDLRRAVVLIGRKELHSIAVAMAMMAAVQSDQPLAKKLSNASVLSATFARILATHVGQIDTSLAFLAGLLCEIGALACLSVDGEGYSAIYAKAAGLSEVLAGLEKERYGLTSIEVGAEMLHRNLLPKPVIGAISLVPGSDLTDAPPLQRVTLCARLVTPVIIEGAKNQDIEAIKSNCMVIADSTGFEIDENTLLEMAVTSATAAELRLRGRAVD